jgi:hypothetical protein
LYGGCRKLNYLFFSLLCYAIYTAKIFLLELKGRGAGGGGEQCGPLFLFLVLSAVVGVTLTNSSTDWLTVLEMVLGIFLSYLKKKNGKQWQRIQPKKMLENASNIFSS